MATTGGRRAYAPRVPPEQRREQLLDAALDLVVTRGHDTATVDAVAARAGVTKPVLYGVFTGRADMLAALLAREGAHALAQLADVLGTLLPEGAHDARTGDTDLHDVLARALEGFLRAVHTAPQRWSCIVLPLAGMPTAFHEARERARADVHAQVVEVVRAGVDTGVLPAGLDVVLAAHVVVSLAETAARLTLAEPEHPVENVVDGARGLLAALAQT